MQPLSLEIENFLKFTQVIFSSASNFLVKQFFNATTSREVDLWNQHQCAKTEV